jgi:hypothetical protein
MKLGIITTLHEEVLAVAFFLKEENEVPSASSSLIAFFLKAFVVSYLRAISSYIFKKALAINLAGM